MVNTILSNRNEINRNYWVVFLESYLSNRKINKLIGKKEKKLEREQKDIPIKKEKVKKVGPKTKRHPDKSEKKLKNWSERKIYPQLNL